MRFRISCVVAFAAMAAACIDKAEIDDNETTDKLVTDPEIQDYNPANSIIPFPNALLTDRATGLNALPATCGESAATAALRTQVLNTLDGYGTWLPTAYATFTSEVDLASTDGHVFMIKQTGDASTAVAVPARVGRYRTLRYEQALPVCGASNIVEGITIVPTIPLDDNSVYTVSITQGVKSTTGDEFEPSSAWFFSRQDAPPVSVTDNNGDGVITTPDEITSNYTPLDKNDSADLNRNGVADVIEQLGGINQLYQLNQSFLPFVNSALTKVTGEAITRDDILIAWAFKTQTVEIPVDPKATKGPASHVDDAPISFGFGAPLASDGGAPTPSQFIEGALQQPGACAQLGCAAINTVLGGQFLAQNYQVPAPNPTGLQPDPVPGPWASPIDPPAATGPAPLNVIAVVPKGTVPAGGWPVVIFGHGITRSKGDLLAIASQLASARMASIAVDWPLHGDRAVQIYPSGSACQDPTDAGAATFTISPECFQPILSTNLPGTRDNLRQGVIDVLRMIESMRVCDGGAGAGCGTFNVNMAHVGFLGQSLGSIIGSVPVGTSPDIKAAVLNVPGVSLLTVLENTDTNAIKCPLFDALIKNGTLQGKLWQQDDGNFNETDALCIQPDTTKPVAVAGDPTNPQYPVYQTFANAARWVLDPSDGVNFVDREGAKIKAGGLALLVQEVQGDVVVPNESTNILGALLGFQAPTNATIPTSATFTASAGLNNPATVASWLLYTQSATTIYSHGSLLAPAAVTAPADAPRAALATGQMQTDAITFLVTHLSSAPAGQAAK